MFSNKPRRWAEAIVRCSFLFLVLYFVFFPSISQQSHILPSANSYSSDILGFSKLFFVYINCFHIIYTVLIIDCAFWHLNN